MANRNRIPIPTGLDLNDEEQEVFNRLSRRERRAFNNLPDNNSKLGFIRGLMAREQSEREKSVRLAKRDIYIFILL